MILVYTPATGSRSDYAFDLILGDLLGVMFRVTTDRKEFLSFTGPRLNYSTEPVGEGLFIPPAGLLSEQEISPCDPEVAETKGIPVLYPTTDLRASLPFDLFSAAFFLVTRYEEYFPLQTDANGRYRPEESIAFRHGFLKKPVVNLWAEWLRKILNESYPSLQTRQRSYRFLPTLDIDHAYAYRQRGILRTAGSFLRCVLRRDGAGLAARLKVMLNLRKDPFDVYDRLIGLHVVRGLSPLWFVLFADYGGDDNGVNPNGRAFQQLLLNLDENGTVGIHPSKASNSDFSLLETEVFGLSNFIGRDVSASRQHFLMLAFPETYKRLTQVGIADDYSMGYATTTGFRAGIATPFPFYDLVAGRRTELTVHPFVFMDVTLKNYMGLSSDQAHEEIRQLSETVRSVGGELVSLWHNESLSGVEGWQGWEGVYEAMLDIVTSNSSAK